MRGEQMGDCMNERMGKWLYAQMARWADVEKSIGADGVIPTDGKRKSFYQEWAKPQHP